jgi:hypothetical protein
MNRPKTMKSRSRGDLFGAVCLLLITASSATAERTPPLGWRPGLAFVTTGVLASHRSQPGMQPAELDARGTFRHRIRTSNAADGLQVSITRAEILSTEGAPELRLQLERDMLLFKAEPRFIVSRSIFGCRRLFAVDKFASLITVGKASSGGEYESFWCVGSPRCLHWRRLQSPRAATIAAKTTPRREFDDRDRRRRHDPSAGRSGWLALRRHARSFPWA